MKNPVADPIIYIPGALADHIGSIAINQLAERAASLTRSPVEIQTHGVSLRHGETRFKADPKPLVQTADVTEDVIRRLQIALTEKKSNCASLIESCIATLQRGSVS